MAYVKTVWVAGDIITAEKLNKIEDALAEMLNGNAEAEEAHIGNSGDLEPITPFTPGDNTYN